MTAEGTTDYIVGAKACIATRNVLDGRGRVRWLFRDEPLGLEDSGWRVLSEFDTEEYINEPTNNEVVSYNRVCDVEPACIIVYDMPIGSDVEIRYPRDGRITVHDSRDGGRDITDELMGRGRG